MMTAPAFNRRHFLKSTLAAAAAVSLAPPQLRSSAAQPDLPNRNSTPTWVDKPMRWAQLTLVEDDPGRFDLAFWLDYFHRTRSDAVCLSAGGCVAYYPTKIPLHHRSRWLGDSDVLGELIAGCRKLGMVIIVRTDPHATYDDVEAAHPDWIAVDAEGKKRRHWASPEMWVTCGLGPYNFEFMTEVKKEIMSRYHVDGIFINRWDGSGMCYCEHCQRNFKQNSGLELPRTNNPQDPARHAYILWRQQRLFELWQTWDQAIRAINPNSCVIPNTGGGATSSLDMKTIGELAPTLMADRQARRGLMAPWAIGTNAKEYRATMGNKPIVGIFSVGVEEPYRWKDSVQSPAEIRVWVADLVANGMRPWFTKFGAVLRDERWLKPVEETYQRLARWEKYLRNERALARVAVVYSQQTGWFVGNEIEGHIDGWCQALIEARIPFELVHDRLLDHAHVSQFKTLILPNLAALSDAQCRQIEQFVVAGGSIIATHQTSLCNEWGVRRDNFGLAGMFGVDFSGKLESRMQNAYLRLEHQTAPRHPLLRGLEDAPRIIHGVARVEVKPREQFPPMPLTLIPSYPDLPMEMVYPRTPKTDIAQVFLRETGKGRVVYFPWDIDRTFWEVLSPDHGKLLRNAVEWATNEPPRVTVTGPGLLDVTVWQQQNSITVHLVNLTNPMLMKGPIRELIPVGEQKVQLHLPAGVRARKVHLLAAQKVSHTTASNSELIILVPSILDHEVIAVDL
ncbi:MAG TPA: beta-galactosidase trimerization domain-containing protein [Candidatus Limnocylindrales bacterium]|nr:beta-galactosidase trimerization domain-containing protein [Candidatus Limnocylindrales bacterium]